jgi:C1A family cysteine protease
MGRSAVARTNKKYGWIPDLPDHRDHRYAAPRAVLAKLPAKIDLRPKCPPVLQQGELGACTAHAIGNAHRFNQRKLKAKGEFLPSRLFIYYNERAILGTIREDSGAMIRDGIKSIAKQGACPETLWPYDIAKFAKRPPAAAFKEAEKHQAILYQRVAQTLPQMKGCLASGNPFVFGFTVYESFETEAVAKTGKMPLPAPSEKNLGGHAVLAVGYDDKKQVFIVQNSWSAQWGDKGYFYMPYAYLLDENLSDDLWVVTMVET